MRSMWKWAFGLGAALSLTGALSAGCGSSGGGTGGGSGGGSASCSGDLASIQQTIFKTSCATAGCHTTAGAPNAGDLDLSGDAASVLVNVPSSTCPQQTRVVPGSPSTSFLYLKLTTAQPSCGAQMPIGKPLTDEQKSCIEQWISSLPPGGNGGSGGGGGADAGSDAMGCEQCGGADCLDLMNDPQHCGSCSKACPTGATCVAGACQCPGTQQDCGGACADTSSDPAHCGSCATTCNTGQLCAGGQCASGCGSLTQCGNTCCPAGASCTGGQCVCPAGTSACNGVCINTDTDSNNCGGCGKVCPSGTSCSGGACACTGGGTLCNGACVDTQSDANNCGMCGNACAVGQTCSNGSCMCGSASVSFSGAVQPIFTAKCTNAGCHGGVMPAGNLSLKSGQSYSALVNVLAGQCNDGRKRVLPGQPATSYIIQKMMGMNICFGTKMPKLGGVSSAEIETIADWICAGAPNN